MTHTEYTKNILNIKDKNVFFNENSGVLQFVNKNISLLPI